MKKFVLFLICFWASPVKAQNNQYRTTDGPCTTYNTGNIREGCDRADCTWVDHDKVRCQRVCTKDEEFERDKACAASREAWNECQRDSWGCYKKDIFTRDKTEDKHGKDIQAPK